MNSPLRWLALSLGGSAVIAVACSKGGNGVTNPPPPSTGALRFVNAMPKVGYADVFSDTGKAISSLKYDKGTDYAIIDSGTHRIKFLHTNTTDTVLIGAAAITPAHTFTFLAVDSQGTKRGILAFDSNTAPKTTAIKLRFIHAASSQPTVDVYATAVGDTLPPAPTFAGVAFGAISPYLLLPPGSYQVRVTAAGSRIVAVDDTLNALPNGAVRTVISLDSPGGGLPLITLTLPDTHVF